MCLSSEVSFAFCSASLVDASCVAWLPGVSGKVEWRAATMFIAMLSSSCVMSVVGFVPHAAQYLNDEFCWIIRGLLGASCFKVLMFLFS